MGCGCGWFESSWPECAGFFSSKEPGQRNIRYDPLSRVCRGILGISGNIFGDFWKFWEFWGIPGEFPKIQNFLITCEQYFLLGLQPEARGLVLEAPARF
jgi:hypothetical protein